MTPPLPPRPKLPTSSGIGQKPPALLQYVGPDDTRIDVAKLSDRGIAIKGLDLIMWMQHAMKTHSDEFVSFKRSVEEDKVALLKMATDFEHRLSALEGRPREPLASIHEWDELLTVAGHELSKRVRDKKDNLDSNRAREIAKEVVENVKVVEDAKAFRQWKLGGSKIIMAALKAIAIAALGFAASHFGLHSGHLTNDAPHAHVGDK